MKLKSSTILLLTLSLPLLLGADVSVKRATQSDAKSGRAVQQAKQTVPINREQEIQPSAPALPDVSQGTPSPASVSSSASYSIDWYSMNGGGAIEVSSPSYKMGSSVGQSVAGNATSASYQMGVGFWYGTGGGCSCPNQGDVNPDLVVDVFDVIQAIAIAFSGGVDITDPGCPTSRCDVNNDAAADVFDVIYLIATAFSGGPNPVNPCAP